MVSLVDKEAMRNKLNAIYDIIKVHFVSVRKFFVRTMLRVCRLTCQLLQSFSSFCLLVLLVPFFNIFFAPILGALQGESGPAGGGCFCSGPEGR